MEIKSQIKSLLDELNKGVYEKEEVIALTLLTAVAGESIFLLGAPGVAKSLIARRLKFAFTGGSSFEYLMNRFSTPDEIFGPVSISKLKDEDKYERIINNYLPAATVVFLDEIWKAGPSIQNALLTVLNEKIYRNGDREIHVPMKALIAASNELPMKGEGLEALWDRFLVRCFVSGIEKKKNFNDMISNTLNNYEDTVSPSNKLTGEKYSSLAAGIDDIQVPEEIFSIIHIIRVKIQAYNKAKQKEKDENLIYISDRRWRKILRLMRASALLNDRTSVDMMDCFLIIHCIWHEPEQHKTVADFVKETIKEHGYLLAMNLPDVQEALGEFYEDVVKGCSFVKKIKYKEPEIFYEKYYKLKGGSFGISYNGTFDLISQKEFKSLKDEPKFVFIHCDSGTSHDGDKAKKWLIAKGKTDDTVTFDSKAVNVVLVERQRPETYTMKPPAPLEKKFLERYNLLINTTADMKKRLEENTKRDLLHLRTNLFVNPAFAELVEASSKHAFNEIEKAEVEANRIKHYWENVADETGEIMKP